MLIVSFSTAAPVDHNATAETKLFFNQLMNITHNTGKILFGHQQDTMMGAYGYNYPYWKLGSPHDGGIQGWLFQPGQVDSNSEDELSDIKSITDDRKRSAYLIKKASDRGLLITIAWHLSNPVSDGSPWVNNDKSGKDIRHSIRRILANGGVHSKFKRILDGVVDFIKSLIDSHGSTIPVIFRPYHEMNGGWFWWGTSSKTENTPDDFKQLFQFTVHYLRDIRQVHNILFAYSPDKPFNTADEYLTFYP
ncbi:gmuG [Mytilus coruscus]|uniref:GmuG n=1 Tax=Mytilus coruscus TaxID=42192 RepID=A0A6J8AK19_MYTCO|nr:gmuG [Mytilus coruscus]